MDSRRRRGGTTWCAVTICPQSVWTRADCPPACLLYALARLRSRLSRDDAHESSGMAISAADQDCPNHRAGVNEGEETPGASGLAPSVVTEEGLLFLLRFLLICQRVNLPPRCKRRITSNYPSRPFPR